MFFNIFYLKYYNLLKILKNLNCGDILQIKQEPPVISSSCPRKQSSSILTGSVLCLLRFPMSGFLLFFIFLLLNCKNLFIRFPTLFWYLIYTRKWTSPSSYFHSFGSTLTSQPPRYRWNPTRRAVPPRSRCQSLQHARTPCEVHYYPRSRREVGKRRDASAMRKSPPRVRLLKIAKEETIRCEWDAYAIK